MTPKVYILPDEATFPDVLPGGKMPNSPFLSGGSFSLKTRGATFS